VVVLVLLVLVVIVVVVDVDAIVVGAVVVVVVVVTGGPPAARQKYVRLSQTITVVSRLGSYSGAPGSTQSQASPVRGSVHT